MTRGHHPTGEIISTDIVVQLEQQEARSCPVQVKLSFDPAETHATEVTLSFRTGRRRWVHWTIARELLRAGLAGPSGEGDVSLAPTGAYTVRLMLSSPSGHAEFSCYRPELTEFLTRTDRAVAPGHELEHYDMDTALASLLNESTR